MFNKIFNALSIYFFVGINNSHLYQLIVNRYDRNIDFKIVCIKLNTK